MIRDLRNRLDYFLRNNLHWGRPISLDEPVHPRALQLQAEVFDFLDEFNWEKHLGKKSKINPFKVADIGTRTFAFAMPTEKSEGVFQVLNVVVRNCSKEFLARST